MKTPGRAAFERWLELTPNAAHMTWDSIPPEGRAGWEEVAKATIEQWIKKEDTEGRRW